MDVFSHFVLLDRYDRALAAIRAALAASGLDIASEWDVAYDLRQDYGVVLAPCRIITVYHSLNLLQNMVMDASYALSGQVSIAVCDADGHARVLVRGQQRDLFEQVVSALRQIGVRQLAPASAA